MQALKLIIPGEPIAKHRPRFSRTGHAYSDQAREETICKNIVQSQLKPHWEPRSEALQIKMTFYVGMSQKARKEALKQKYDESEYLIPCTKRPDLDNYIKFYLDAFNSLIYVDDNQIYEIAARKYLSIEPRTVIEIFW